MDIAGEVHDDGFGIEILEASIAVGPGERPKRLCHLL
jgi:hypothetical protein